MKKNGKSELAIASGRALRRAGRAARETARLHGTPLYFWRDGKVIAEEPGTAPRNARSVSTKT